MTCQVDCPFGIVTNCTLEADTICKDSPKGNATARIIHVFHTRGTVCTAGRNIVICFLKPWKLPPLYSVSDFISSHYDVCVPVHCREGGMVGWMPRSINWWGKWNERKEQREGKGLDKGKGKKGTKLTWKGREERMGKERKTKEGKK